MAEAEQGQTRGWLAVTEVIVGGAVAVVGRVVVEVEVGVPFFMFLFTFSHFLFRFPFLSCISSATVPFMKQPHQIHFLQGHTLLLVTNR